jgi:hypothetical protein
MAASPPPDAVTTRTRPGGVVWLVVAVLLAGLASPAQARGRRARKGAAKSAASGAPVRGETHRAFPGVHLLALADDQILLWEASGRAHLRTSDGIWNAEMQLPAAGILDVQRDGSGFLVAGALAAGGAAVVSLSATGQPQVRWSIPGEGVHAVFADAAGRHAVTRAGIIDLHPDGTFGKAQPFPADPRPPGFGGLPIMVLARAGDQEGALVICSPASAGVAATPAAAPPIAGAAVPPPAGVVVPPPAAVAPTLAATSSTRGVCERPAPGAWKLQEDFQVPPVVCGGSIVITTSARARQGAGASAILAYAWDTGKIQNRAKAAGTPAIACAVDGDALMVGEKQLRLFHLPSMKPAWTHPIGRVAAREVAVTKHFIAYRAGDSPDVQVVPRPPAAR